MTDVGSMFQETVILPGALKEESAVLCCPSLNKLFLAPLLSQQKCGAFLGMRRLYLIYKEGVTFLGHTWHKTFF